MGTRRARLLTLLVAGVLAIAGVTVIDPFAQPARAAVDSQSLGGRFDAAKANITFRVFSSRATKMVVDVYAAPTGAQEKVELELTKDAATNIFAATVSVADLHSGGVTGTVYYGYRAWGPNWPFAEGWTKGSSTGFVTDVDAAGNRFNPNKLLLDPYAREVSHDPRTPDQNSEAPYRSGPESRGVDSGPVAPKGIVLAADDAGVGSKPTRPLKDDVVYEVNLRGFTKADSGVPQAARGTYKGAGLKAGYLASLGVTAVEFLPVQDFQNDANDVDATGTTDDNYWGYDPLNFFAPDRRYSSDKAPGGPTAEFKQMVKAFHDAGIKVITDVVYNHTGEKYVVGGDKQVYNLLTYRGLDNPTYYSLTSDMQGSFDNTGVGGNFNTFNPVAQNLIVDSLAYWNTTLGVDGFRADLAPLLGNTCEHGCFKYDKANQANALNHLLREIPARPATGGAGADWIAEPWALGEGTYQLGNFPAGWSEWNGMFRDTLRHDQNQLGSAAVTPGELATRFAGSSDLFGDDGRKPGNSVNFAVVHDGLSLKDLYSCNGKNNGQAWPYGPSDGGSDDNGSWDQNGVAADQRKAARNGMAAVMLSAGTPLMTGGDEMLRSMRCNNNSYNVDSSANWLNWTLSADQTNFATFTKRLIAYRDAHPALRPANFYTADDTNGNGLGQLQWFTPAGAAPDEAYWSNPDNHALAWRIDGTELGDPAAAQYVAYNGWSGDVTFTLPAPPEGTQWHLVTDTSTFAEGPNQFAAPGAEGPIGGAGTTYLLHGRGTALLLAK